METQERVDRATWLSFVGRYSEAAEELCGAKETLSRDDDYLILINVKLSRCYEHMGDIKNCELCWSDALAQLKQMESKETPVAKMGRSELYINRLRALLSQDTPSDEQVKTQIDQIEEQLTDQPPNLSLLQYLFMCSKYYQSSSPLLSIQSSSRCLQLIAEVKKQYQDPQGELQVQAFDACIQYLQRLEKQLTGIKIFCTQRISHKGNQEQCEDKEEAEEVSDDWEEANVKE